MVRQAKSMGVVLLLVLLFAVQTGFAAPTVSEGVTSLFSSALLENIGMIKDVCGRQTLEGLANGKVIVTDEVVNKMIQLDLDANSQKSDLKELTVHFKEGNRIDLHTKSTNGSVFEGSGIIKEFRHDRLDSIIRLKLDKKEVPDKGLYSWMVARFSLGFVTSFLGGSIKLDEDTKVKIHGNDVSVSLKESLSNSQASKIELMGVKFIDCIKINSAKSYDGYVELDTELDLADQYRDIVSAAIKLIP